MTCKRAIGTVVLLFGCVALAMGCTASGEAPSPSLPGTKWMLTALRGIAPIEGAEITLRFEDEFLTGTMGCNGYGGGHDSGNYVADDGRLEVPRPLAVTVQLCSEPEGIMEQEDAYLDALLSAVSYHVEDDRLEIADADGNTVLVFDRSE